MVFISKFKLRTIILFSLGSRQLLAATTPGQDSRRVCWDIIINDGQQLRKLRL